MCQIRASVFENGSRASAEKSSALSSPHFFLEMGFLILNGWKVFGSGPAPSSPHFFVEMAFLILTGWNCFGSAPASFIDSFMSDRLSSSSAMEKFLLNPAGFPSCLKIHAPSEWNVPIHGADVWACGPEVGSSRDTRFFISFAVLLVKVIARMLSGRIPPAI